jgi:hypothetical protein
MKHCLLCVHCYYCGAEPGYSEMTPGTEASLYCLKGCMRHAGKRTLFEEAWTRQQVREALQSAHECPHYVAEVAS